MGAGYDLTQVGEMGLFEEYLEMVVQFGFVTIFVAAFPLAPLFALINNVIEIRLDAYKYVTQVRRPVPQRAQDIGIWFGILKGVTFIAVLTNAFIVGWTSDFVPKLVYSYSVSPEGNLKGYINNSLAFFDVKDFQNQSRPAEPSPQYENITYCRYTDYRHGPWEENPYTYTSMYWHVFTARLAFIICFEHLVFFLTWLVSYLIPDIPARVKQLMLRELYIAKEARYETAFSTIHHEKLLRQESEAHELESP
jgi:anoctamin-4